MKKILLIAILLFFFSAQQGSAAEQMFVCGKYFGNCLAASACPTAKPATNTHGYCKAGSCCMPQAQSDKLNSDVVKSGNTPTVSPKPAANRTGNQAVAVTTSPGGGAPTPSPGGGTPAPSPGGGVPAPNPGGGAPAPNGPTASNNVQITFAPPTQYTTVETFLDSVIGFARNIVVILALVFLIIGALIYITSGGNEKRIGTAKAAITAALVGLAIVMVAPSFLKELAGVLGWNDLPSQASDALSLTQIATNVLNFLLAIIGVLAIIMFMIGAIMYLTAAGDEKRAGTGKSIVQSAIIGIIVAFSALVIVKQIAAFFLK